MSSTREMNCRLLLSNEAIEHDNKLEESPKMLSMLEQAKDGNPSTKFRIGYAYYKINNMGKAIEWFKKSARDGFTPAEMKLAEIYHLGTHGAPNRKESLKWYKKASKKNPLALVRLGEYFNNIQDENYDYFKAAKYFHEARLQGEYKSHASKSDIRQNPKFKRKFERMPCSKSDREWMAIRHKMNAYDSALYQSVQVLASKAQLSARDQIKIGYYMRMTDSLSIALKRQGVKESFFWFSQAASNNDPRGLFELGICYLNGLGIKPNEELAIDNFKKAILFGGNYASIELANYYYKMNDNQLAICYYEISAKSGNTDAIDMLDSLEQSHSYLPDQLDNASADEKHSQNGFKAHDALDNTAPTVIPVTQHNQNGQNELIHSICIEENEIDKNPCLQAYCERLITELTKFTQAYWISTSGLFPLKDNKKSTGLNAAGNILNITGIFMIFKIGLEKANEKYRFYQINRLADLFTDTNMINEVYRFFAIKLTLAKANIIKSARLEERNSIKEKALGFYQDVSAAIIKAAKDWKTSSDTTGIKLQPSEALAMLDASFLLEQILLGKVKINKTRDAKKLAVQFLQIFNVVCTQSPKLSHGLSTNITSSHSDITLPTEVSTNNNKLQELETNILKFEQQIDALEKNISADNKADEIDECNKKLQHLNKALYSLKHNPDVDAVFHHTSNADYKFNDAIELQQQHQQQISIAHKSDYEIQKLEKIEQLLNALTMRINSLQRNNRDQISLDAQLKVNQRTIMASKHIAKPHHATNQTCCIIL